MGTPGLRPFSGSQGDPDLALKVSSGQPPGLGWAESRGNPIPGSAYGGHQDPRTLPPAFPVVGTKGRL